MFAIIEKEVYVEGSGYSYTEDFETVRNVPATYTAADVVKCLDEDSESGYKAHDINKDSNYYYVFKCYFFIFSYLFSK